MRLLSSWQTLTFFNCWLAAVIQRHVTLPWKGGGEVGWTCDRGTVFDVICQRNVADVFCHLLCSASAAQEWCHWRYYEPLSNSQRSETQISATQKCKQTHLSSVEVSQRRPEFFFDFTKMVFHSRINWWGVPGIQPLMSFFFTTEVALRLTAAMWVVRNTLGKTWLICESFPHPAIVWIFTRCSYQI